jgi:Glycoside Hydrolase Family 113
MLCALLLSLLLLAGAECHGHGHTSPPAPTRKPTGTPPALKVNGVQLLNGQWSPPKYNSTAAASSLRLLRESTGASHVALTFCLFQASVDSAGPIYPRPSTPTDQQLETAVRVAHARGLQVMLRPGVDPDWSLPGNAGTWRGEIGRNFTAAQWAVWFPEYEHMVVRYARLAARWVVAQFSVGFEYSVAQRHDAEFRCVVAAVRAVYAGELTYGANWGTEDALTWWDAVDYIGVDAYYPLAPQRPSPTLAQLRGAWAPLTRSLAALSARHSRTVLFTEIGYCSVAHANVDPAHCHISPATGVDLAAQTTLYRAFFEAVYPQRWFAGTFWWAWLTDPRNGGPHDPSFTPAGKPASLVLLEHFQLRGNASTA